MLPKICIFQSSTSIAFKEVFPFCGEEGDDCGCKTKVPEFWHLPKLFFPLWLVSPLFMEIVFPCSLLFPPEDKPAD